MQAAVSYAEFIAQKHRRFASSGAPYSLRNPHLYGFQSEIVARALAKGRYCIFADCGLGKTLMELEWGTNVPGRVLLLTPLGVTRQIEAEADRFGFDAKVGDGSGGNKITITNYERLHRY
ncbi:unnamed protein product, partial [marine sediment metagenome]